LNWQTHEISNQFDELNDYNLSVTDIPLRQALPQAGWTSPPPGMS
jgi:putative acyl-CoA dehydrogenase